MGPFRIPYIKRRLAFILSRKVDLTAQFPDDGRFINDGQDRLCVNVSGLRRGLHFLSIRYRSNEPLIGPRICWETDGGEEGDDQVFIFENFDRNEIFGTVYLGDGVRELRFYPSRLECSVVIETAHARPITEFYREYRYGVGFVRYKMFGAGWWLKSALKESIQQLSRLLRRGERGTYQAWWERYGRCSNSQLEDQRSDHDLIANGPLISIVLPTFESDLELLREAIDSVLSQTYSRWQLCICDDASSSAELRKFLTSLSSHDRRIEVVYRKENGHISQASNDALSLADGDYVGFLDHDDLLVPDALYRVASEIRKDPRRRLLYSDEDLVDIDGRPVNGHFKPDWNQDLLRSINYVCHFLVVKKSLVNTVGGFRVGFEGAQDYDLLLRASEQLSPEEIHHIPRVLYHWRAAPGSTAATVDNKPYAAQAGILALSEHIIRLGLPARAEASEIETAYRVKFALPQPAPRVAIVIPTRDNLRVLKNCVRSLEHMTEYPNYEVVIVDNDSADPVTASFLTNVSTNDRVTVSKYPGPFNFSAINNFAVNDSDAEFIVLLNNDTEPLNRDWLTELVSQAARPEVGAVGAKLFYANDRIQHAGVILGLGGDQIAGHAFKGKHRNAVGSLARTRLVQQYSAVTGACLAVSREKYLAVGGLNEDDLSVAYNDVDFCLKLAEAGYCNIWTPYAQLYHFESYSRGPDSASDAVARYESEAEYMRKRWSENLFSDPNYNNNLSRGLYSFDLAWPPYPAAQ